MNFVKNFFLAGALFSILVLSAMEQEPVPSTQDVKELPLNPEVSKTERAPVPSEKLNKARKRKRNRNRKKKRPDLLNNQEKSIREKSINDQLMPKFLEIIKQKKSCAENLSENQLRKYLGTRFVENCDQNTEDFCNKIYILLNLLYFKQKVFWAFETIANKAAFFLIDLPDELDVTNFVYSDNEASGKNDQRNYILNSSEAKAGLLQFTHLLKLPGSVKRARQVLNPSAAMGDASSDLGLNLNKRTLSDIIIYTPRSKLIKVVNRLSQANNKELNDFATWIEFQGAKTLLISLYRITFVRLLPIYLSMKSNLNFMNWILELLENEIQKNSQKDKMIGRFELYRLYDSLQEQLIFEDFMKSFLSKEDIIKFVEMYLPEIFPLLSLLNVAQKLIKRDCKENNTFYREWKSLFDISAKINSISQDIKLHDKKLYEILRKMLFEHKPKKKGKEHLAFVKRYNLCGLATDFNILRLEQLPLSLADSEIELASKKNSTAFKSKKRISKANRKKNKKGNCASYTDNKKSQNTNDNANLDWSEKADSNLNAVIDNKNPEICTAGGDSEIQELIYSPRIHRWFDESFVRAQNQSSVLYHTFNPAADALIVKYGIQKNCSNQKNPNNIDTRYYMAGEIIWPDGRKKTVLFCICKDKDGVIYHRGFEAKDKNNELFDEFATNEFEYNFPALTLDLDEKSVDNKVYQIKKEKDNQVKETNFCFYIEDKVNKVTIVLFKLDSEKDPYESDQEG